MALLFGTAIRRLQCFDQESVMESSLVWNFALVIALFLTKMEWVEN